MDDLTKHYKTQFESERERVLAFHEFKGGLKFYLYNTDHGFSDKQRVEKCRKLFEEFEAKLKELP